MLLMMMKMMCVCGCSTSAAWRCLDPAAESRLSPPCAPSVYVSCFSFISYLPTTPVVLVGPLEWDHSSDPGGIAGSPTHGDPTPVVLAEPLEWDHSSGPGGIAGSPTHGGSTPVVLAEPLEWDHFSGPGGITGSPTYGGPTPVVLAEPLECQCQCQSKIFTVAKIARAITKSTKA